MSYGVSKKGNSYARRLLHIDAPKTVWMAIALSLAMRIRDDDWDNAVAEVAEEWRILHANGIVPQKPRIRSAEVRTDLSA